eukprot:TRINITY_DN58622_c0_g1_i1.p1 TRINITY_DN58622_c0_g1~~TRINITY_DN58622_c0_g1_i1.p1  ORF type:complete len:183 (-),score=32.02 TRINITY_DN58622_c0_g1_i1:48-596(-)
MCIRDRCKMEKATGGLSTVASDQLNIILDVLGTPSPEDCEFIKDEIKIGRLLDRPPKAPTDLSKLYPQAEANALNLLKRMLIFNPYKRASVNECLADPYFADIRKIEEEITSKEYLDFKFDKERILSISQLRELINEELEYFTVNRNKGLIKYSSEIQCNYCLLYTSPSPRDLSTSRMPSSA